MMDGRNKIQVSFGNINNVQKRYFCPKIQNMKKSSRKFLCKIKIEHLFSVCNYTSLRYTSMSLNTVLLRKAFTFELVSLALPLPRWALVHSGWPGSYFMNVLSFTHFLVTLF